MQNWLSGGVNENDEVQPKASSSLLAGCNSYAFARSPEEISSGGVSLVGGFADDTVSGSFSVVSKGVRDISGNIKSAASFFPSLKALKYFGLFLASGVFFVIIAFILFLPVIALVPQIFAICFTMGCGFIVGSFFALKGPKNQFNHMTSKKMLPFTLGLLGCMVGTIYGSMALRSCLLSLAFSLFQVLALAYYLISYFPGGSYGRKFVSSYLMSCIWKCFGRR